MSLTLFIPLVFGFLIAAMLFGAWLFRKSKNEGPGM